MFVASPPCELPALCPGPSLTDISLTDTNAALAARVASAAKAGAGDTRFRLIAWSAAVILLLIFLGVIAALLAGAWPAISTFGLGFLTTEAWRPTREIFGALGPIYGILFTNIFAMVFAVLLGIFIVSFVTFLVPLMLRRPIVISVCLMD